MNLGQCALTPPHPTTPIPLGKQPETSHRLHDSTITFQTTIYYYRPVIRLLVVGASLCIKYQTFRGFERESSWTRVSHLSSWTRVRSTNGPLFIHRRKTRLGCGHRTEARRGCTVVVILKCRAKNIDLRSKGRRTPPFGLWMNRNASLLGSFFHWEPALNS